MKSLIIYAHPETEGHNKKVKDAIEELLKTSNQETVTINLYKGKFNPVLEKEELYTIGNDKISKQAKKYQELLSEADRIIVIHPVWWNSMPAILKGFYDKVLTPHYAYQFSDKGVPEGLLKEKKVAIIYTTGGPKIYELLIGKARGIKAELKDIWGFCGVKGKAYGIYNAKNEPNEQEIDKIARKAIKYLSLDTQVITEELVE
ncbi:NAD(P)H-dependent oxidoreductase [Candidatus Woesearchaeota archaeon]|nr:NAD(P)H-dependent oxidoreductase [Candidatus Woesearchaeota archaeon]